MSAAPKKWRWYHYAVSVFGWIFLISFHGIWIFGPWYLVLSEYYDLKQGIEVTAVYASSRAVYSDTKHDYEKEYMHFYRFTNPATGENMEYSTIGLGIGSRAGSELHLKFNPETGTIGFGSFLPTVISKLRYVISSFFGLVWALVVFTPMGWAIFLHKRPRSKRKNRVLERLTRH